MPRHISYINDYERLIPLWKHRCFTNEIVAAMGATASADLMDELEVALKERSAEGRARTLRRLSELLRSCAERLNPSQIGIFDDVLIRLLDCVGATALAELSNVLADFAASPERTVRKLARHQNSAVAAPLLSRSPILVDADLIEIVKSRTQQHLTAIASRQNLNDALTDAILKLAGRDASRTLAKNPSARFSSNGLAVLLVAGKRDETIAESLGLRPDLPAATLQALLSGSSERVRTRLLKAAPAELRERIQTELVSIDAQAKPQAQDEDHSEAHAAVAALSRTGKLNDSTVNRFAIRREYANVIAALSLLSGAAVETIAPLMEESGGEGLIIACRASRLDWQTASAVLNNRRVPPLSTQQLEQAKEMFEMLFVSAAQYAIRFEPPGALEAASRSNANAAAGAHA
jgi:uncharacterized protein (DUF2336 family)